jgi:hypothetical protein
MNRQPHSQPTLPSDPTNSPEDSHTADRTDPSCQRLAQLVGWLLARRWLRDKHTREPTLDDLDNSLSKPPR